MIQPKRIQRKRTEGFNLQEYSKSLNGLECTVVSRFTKWGNPFLVERLGLIESIKRYRECITNNAMTYIYFDELEASIQYERFLWMSNNLHTLHEKNLACFCPLSLDCHADVLLELSKLFFNINI